MTQMSSNTEEPRQGQATGQGQSLEQRQGLEQGQSSGQGQGLEQRQGLEPGQPRTASLPRTVSRPTISPALISLFLFCLALCFNLYRLGAPSIWFDEAFSVELARQPLPLLWHIVFGPEPNMELYYLFLHFWLALTGFLGLLPTEAVVRFPSAIFAALSTVVVYLLGRRYINPLAGILAASLYLLNDLQLIYAQQTRAYSLQLLLTCLAWYALLNALVMIPRAHTRRWWLCYILATVLAIYTHLFSLFIVLAQLAAVSAILLLPNPWRAPARQQFLSLALSLLATFILIVPMLLVARAGAKTGWLPIPHLSDLRTLFLTISGDKRIYLFAIALFSLFAVLITTLGYFLQQSRLKSPHTTSIAKSAKSISLAPVPRYLLPSASLIPVVLALLCWFAIPLVVSFVVSQGTLRLFSSRYLVTIVPPLILLIACGVALFPWRLLRIAISLGLLALALYAVPFYYHNAQVEDWNATHWHQQRYQSGDGLVCYDNSLQQGCQVSIEYYLHAYPGAAHFTPDSPGLFSWQNYGPANPAKGPDAAVDPQELAHFATSHTRLFFIVGRVRDSAAATRARAARHWLDQHYHRVTQIETHTVSIYLYTTAT
jgi:mannosyltransferase